MLYPDDLPLRQKIEAIAVQLYGAAGVDFVGTAHKELALYEKLGYGHLPVCIAKTQYSFSDNAALLNAPEGFRLTVRSARLSAGAGFVVALTGEIMTMPGLGKTPASELMRVSEDGTIIGLH
jgi:formate--tetrahydrofolate ligase